MPVQTLEGGCSRASLPTYAFKPTSNLQSKFIIGQFLYSIRVLPLSFPLNSSYLFLFFFSLFAENNFSHSFYWFTPLAALCICTVFSAWVTIRVHLTLMRFHHCLPRPFSVSARSTSAIPRRHFFPSIHHSKSNDNTEKRVILKWIRYLSSNLIDLLLAQSILSPFQPILCPCHNCHADQQLPQIIFSSCILTSLACSIVFCKSKKVPSLFLYDLPDLSLDLFPVFHLFLYL